MASLCGHNLKIINSDFCYIEESPRAPPISDITETVIKNLRLNWYLGSRKIYYKDVDGYVDEIVMESDGSYRFKPVLPEIITLIDQILEPEKT